jgi:hypothetical protein
MNSAICGGSLHNDSEQDYAIYLFYATQEVFRKAHTQENLSHLLLRMQPWTR